MQTRQLDFEQVRSWAASEGFPLCGVAPAKPLSDITRFDTWTASGFAGEMRYLTDHRAELRRDPTSLLSSAQSIVCVGMLYNSSGPHTPPPHDNRAKGWISRYAWGDDYHYLIRLHLERLATRMRQTWGDFDYRICVDTAPLLERSFARLAGLGWVGKNTCLINQKLGSWFFLGELLTSLRFPPDHPPPDRCGTCRRCIDACPTNAIVPSPDRSWTIDSRLCISYLTIEKKGPVPDPNRPALGAHVFGCDICQDVCPWNRRAPTLCDPAFAPRDGLLAPDLEELANLTQAQFRERFKNNPILRSKYKGFLRNVAIAMGNANLEKFRPALDRLAALDEPVVAEAARWALARLGEPAKLAVGDCG